MLEGTNGAGWWEPYQPLGGQGSGFIPLKMLRILHKSGPGLHTANSNTATQ